MSKDAEVVQLPVRAGAGSNASLPEGPVANETVVEAEPIDEPTKVTLSVDQPYDDSDLLPWQQEEQRRRVLHPAFTREHWSTAWRWYLGRQAHVTLVHGVRIPFYQSKTLLYAPRGAWRILRHLMNWVTDVETRAIKAHAIRLAEVSVRDADAIYHKAERVAAPKRRARRVVLMFLLCVLVGGGAALWFTTPAWVTLLVTLALIDALGYVGKPADKPIFSHAVVKEQYVKLTSDIVVRGLSSTGIPALAAKDAVITFPAPIQRDGEGWRAEVDLPHGTTATEVIKARNKLASGLRRPLGCVWPEGAVDVHEGRLILWVGDKDLAKKGYVRWPLANKGRYDFFSRMPFGEEPRGRLVTLGLFQHNMIIGAIPGQGKTAAGRCIICAEALDPSVELWIHELAGKGDYDPLEVVSHRFVSGIDDESIAYAAQSLKMLRAEAMRRVAVLKSLPKDLCPDKKLTREISDKRSLKLWPLVALFDEVQNLFSHPDYGKAAGEDAEFVIRVGRAVGMTLIFATQRPDKDALPTGVSGNVSIKFCLYVPGQVENDMILGTSSYQNGLRATAPNLRPEIDAGIGILKGATPIPLIVKVAYLNMAATERVAKRARALREAAGTLSGVAVGDVDDSRFEAVSLLDDLQVVYAHCERMDRQGVWSQDLCAGLAELRPEVYGGWDPDALAAALKPYAIRTVQLHMPDENGVRRTRYGLRRELLEKALEVRAERRRLEGS